MFWVFIWLKNNLVAIKILLFALGALLRWTSDSNGPDWTMRFDLVRRIDQIGSLLQTFYQIGSVLKLLTGGVSFLMDGASEAGDTAE